MKLRRLMSFAAAAGIAAGLLCLGQRPAAAEEDIGVETYHNAENGSISYHAYEYPSMKNSFSFSPESYLSFDMVNGKFFMLEHFRVDYEVHTSPGFAQIFPQAFPYPYALRYDDLTVSFFTPDLKLLHEYKQARPNHRYSIPKDGNDYERIICRMEYAGAMRDHTDNASYKVRVWDEIDPVTAEPLNPGKDVYMTNPIRR